MGPRDRRDGYLVGDAQSPAPARGRSAGGASVRSRFDRGPGHALRRHRLGRRDPRRLQEHARRPARGAPRVQQRHEGLPPQHVHADDPAAPPRRAGARARHQPRCPGDRRRRRRTPRPRPRRRHGRGALRGPDQRRRRRDDRADRPRIPRVPLRAHDARPHGRARVRRVHAARDAADAVAVARRAPAAARSQLAAHALQDGVRSPGAVRDRRRSRRRSHRGRDEARRRRRAPHRLDRHACPRPRVRAFADAGGGSRRSACSP
jgi:hypothetical protein